MNILQFRSPFLNSHKGNGYVVAIIVLCFLAISYNLKMIALSLKHQPQAKIKAVLSPHDGDLVTIHYRGYLPSRDYAIFDSSYLRERPFTFKLGQGKIIPGLEKRIKTMALNDHKKFTIPAEEAYGSRGRGRIVPPNSELIFDVELLQIVQQRHLNP